MGIRGTIAIASLVAAAALAGASAVFAATTEVDANGNAFTGGLNFDPREVSVAVGDTVRWTNTDAVVPHTVTEEHELFDLTGTYGGTPANPPGFAPGTSVERVFSAGSFIYFCRVHPEMVGQVSAPVELKRKGSRKKPRVTATWGAEELPEGQVFDVQRSVDGGGFKTVAEGTRELKGKFKAKRGREVAFQARVRLESDASAASGYSPPAEIDLG